MEIAYIQGFLDAFAWVNHKTNHGYSFDITLLERTGSVEEVIGAYISGLNVDEEKVRYNYIPVEASWEKELERNLVKWLFQFQSDQFGGNCFLKDTGKEFSLSNHSFTQMMIKDLVAKFKSIDVDFLVYSVQLDFEKGLYEIEYNDVLLIGKKNSILLHLGQSD